MSVGDINRIIIGVGGTGSRIVDQVYGVLKKLGELKERGLRSTKFIVIDSDKQSLNNLKYIKQRDEHSVKIYLNIPSPSVLKNVNPWLTDELLPAAGQGAGNRRAYGKALYWFHRGTVIHAIAGLMEKMVSMTRSNNFLIILIGALGGGTGSGSLLDLALDLKDLVRKNYANDPFMIGIGIIPGPREHNFNKANAYAALKEIHFLMNYGKDIGAKRSYENPFHSFLLISRTIKGTDKDQELSEAITRFLLDIGFIPYKYRKEAKGEKKDLSDILYRIREYRHSFSTIGYYMVYVPVEEILWLIDSEALYEKTKTIVHEIGSELENIKKEYEKVYKKYDELLRRVKAYLSKLTEQKKKGVSRIKIISKTLDENIKLLQDIHMNLSGAITEKINELDRKINKIIEHKDELLDLSGRLRSEIENIKLSLRSGKHERTVYRASLDLDEIEKIKEIKDSLKKHMNLLKLFKMLNRYDEILDVTINYIASGKITLEPLLNYEHINSYAILERLEQTVGPEVLKLLIKHGVLEYDPDEAKPINQRWKLGYILSLIMTHSSNFDETALGKIAGFKNFAEKYIAVNAEPLILHSEIRRYSFIVYWWMSGLKLFSPAPNDPPRLRDLKWLYDAYNLIDKKEGWRGLITHHAFLLGQPNDLAQIVGEVLEGLTPVQGREYVVKFWRNYEIMDPESILDRLAIILGSLIVSYSKLKEKILELGSFVIPTLDKIVSETSAGLGEPARTGGLITSLRNRLIGIVQESRKSYNNLNAFIEDLKQLINWITKIEKIRKPIKDSILSLSEELTIVGRELYEVYEKYKEELPNLKPKISSLSIYVDTLDNIALKIRLSKIVRDLETNSIEVKNIFDEAIKIYSEMDSLINDVIDNINRMRVE